MQAGRGGESREKENKSENSHSPRTPLHSAQLSKQSGICSLASLLAQCGSLACKQLLEMSQVVVCVSLRDSLGKQSDVTTHGKGGREGRGGEGGEE